MFQLMDAQLKRAKAMKKKGLYISTQPMWLLDLVKADYENMGVKRASTGFQFRSMIDAGLEALSAELSSILGSSISTMGLYLPQNAGCVPGRNSCCLVRQRVFNQKVNLSSLKSLIQASTTSEP